MLARLRRSTASTTGTRRGADQHRKADEWRGFMGGVPRGANHPSNCFSSTQLIARGALRRPQRRGWPRKYRLIHSNTTLNSENISKFSEGGSTLLGRNRNSARLRGPRSKEVGSWFGLTADRSLRMLRFHGDFSSHRPLIRRIVSPSASTKEAGRSCDPRACVGLGSFWG